MPHKKGHTWGDVRKKIGQGFQIGGSAYKGVFTGKGLSNAEKLKKKFRKEDLKVEAKSGKTVGARMEAKNRLVMGDDMIDSIKKRAQKSKDDKAKMQRLKKNNPDKYRKLKKEQRKKKMEKAFTSKSSTWD